MTVSINRDLSVIGYVKPSNVRSNVPASLSEIENQFSCLVLGLVDGHIIPSVDRDRRRAGFAPGGMRLEVFDGGRI